jgi:hypothetical protein
MAFPLKNHEESPKRKIHINAFPVDFFLYISLLTKCFSKWLRMSAAVNLLRLIVSKIADSCGRIVYLMSPFLIMLKRAHVSFEGERMDLDLKKVTSLAYFETL